LRVGDIPEDQSETTSPPDYVDQDHDTEGAEPGARPDTASSVIRKKRELILEKFSRNFDVDLVRQKRSPATFSTPDDKVRVACTISRQYEDSSSPYWFRYDDRWRMFIKEAAQGYFVLGCTDLDVAFVVPAIEMEKILSQLNTTDQYRERESYWHIFIREQGTGQYGIVLSKSGGFLDLSRFAMNLLN